MKEIWNKMLEIVAKIFQLLSGTLFFFTTKYATIRIIIYSCSGTVEDLHTRFTGVYMKRGKPTATIQEQFGINVTFPGTTEYKDR